MRRFLQTPWRLSKGPIWLWAAVVLSLIAIDLLFFRVGLLWRVTPNFGTGLNAENWHFLFTAARAFETERAVPGKTVLAGSSVVVFGADETAINERLHTAGVPPILRLATHGSTATDTALLVWNSLLTHPWLVIYGAAYRDFPKAVPTDTSVIRTFYDSSVDLPVLQPRGAEAALDAHVRRYWKLYRYRFFANGVADALVGNLMLRLSLTRPASAADLLSPPSLPPEAFEYFSPYRITPQTWAAWSKWRETRQFSDYLDFMRLGGAMALENYKSQTMDKFGPDGNPEVESLRWMLGALQEHRTRCVIVYFPQNPVFNDPVAMGYSHPFVSGAYSEVFRREAETHGARFIDLRNLVEAEGFYDMIHLNVLGERKMSARLATIIQEEWERRGEEAR